MNYRQELRRLAMLNGIEPYYDARGGRKHATIESLRTILGLLEVPAQTERETRDSLRACSEKAWTTMVEPVSVAWMEEEPALTLRASTSTARSEIQCELQLENGECKTWSFRPTDSPALKQNKIGRINYLLFKITLPPLPMGCHNLALRSQAGLWRTMLIVAPKLSYSNPELVNSWGLFLPVYAAHSNESWGAGNLSDYARLSRWVGSQGGAFVGSVPILAAFLENWCCEPSPYAPASRLFWNEFFIDISSVPEIAACPQARQRIGTKAFQKELGRFRESSFVDYACEMQARRPILELLAAQFFNKGGDRRTQYEEFLRDRPDVEDYARFRTACEQTGTAWPNWEQRMRDGGISDVDENRVRYHMYAQWVAQEQVDAISRDKDAAEFYLDLPLGVHPNSYDVWREREAFALEASVGAPPDQFFSKGQNWGFAPPHPVKMRQSWYGYLRRVLEFHMKNTGLLRIDHVMALHRLYWVPQHASATDGVYVRYPAEELCALLCLESHRHKTVVVGENLGTVPPEVNALMDRHQFRGMHVLQFSLKPGAQPVAPPQRCELVSLGTHDTPTFAAFWRGDDIDDRLDLGLITQEQSKTEHKERAKTIERVEKYLDRCGLLPKSKHSTLDCIQACLRLLAKSKADMLLIDLEDFWEEPKAQNTPGTTDERPNWRRKARYLLDEVFRMGKLKNMLAELKRLRPGNRNRASRTAKRVLP